MRRTTMRLKGKAAGEKSGVVRRGGPRDGAASAMNPSQFVRVERDGAAGSKHYVLHTHDPRFTLELTPDGAAPNKLGKGIIKRIHVPNSWAGDYTKYSKFVSAAQEFFEQSFDRAAPAALRRRV